MVTGKSPTGKMYARSVHVQHEGLTSLLASLRRVPLYDRLQIPGRKAIIGMFALFGCTSAIAEWTARGMNVTMVNRHPCGAVKSVDLVFGEDNGLTNNLYVAWGDADGGGRIEGWQHWKFLGKVTSETNSFHATVPSASFCRFFLDVPFGEGVFGTPLKSVVGDGTAYADTGLQIRGGDALRLIFNLVSTQCGIMGTRTSVNVENVNLAATSSKFTMDYNNSDYSSYRLTGVSYSTSGIYDVELSAARRRVYSCTGGTQTGINEVLCGDDFETSNNCYLFKVSGAPAVPEVMKGRIFSFTMTRSGTCVANYLPYRFGSECGFFDRVSGRFVTAAIGEFTGEEDLSATTPLTSTTETYSREIPTGETLPRTISSISVKHKKITVLFGEDNGVSNLLYLACGKTKGGDTLDGWDNYMRVGVIDGIMPSVDVDVPSDAKYCRLFLFLPFDGNTPPVQLKYVTGNGSGYFDTGFTGKGGDSVELRMRASNRYKSSIFGCRSETSANVANMVMLLNANACAQIDYTNSDCLSHRCTASEAIQSSLWYELKASADDRSATKISTQNVPISIGSNTTPCSDEFETAYNCYLFSNSGVGIVDDRFAGDIAWLRVSRGGVPYASWQPCKLGDTYGFVDVVRGSFHSPAMGTFTGTADTTVSRLASMSTIKRVNVKGMVICFQ